MRNQTFANVDESDVVGDQIDPGNREEKLEAMEKVLTGLNDTDDCGEEMVDSMETQKLFADKRRMTLTPVHWYLGRCSILPCQCHQPRGKGHCHTWPTR